MTNKQKIVFQAFRDNKTNLEICKKLGINLSNLYSTCWQMRKKGIVLTRAKKLLPVTPKQMEVLQFYMENVPAREIARRMKINCQTVWNLGANGFKRLGLTTPGVDRIAALRSILRPKPITMDDPFFN